MKCFINGRTLDIPLTGVYPEHAIRLIELVPEQVMDLVLRHGMVREVDEGFERPLHGGVIFQDVNGNLFDNKGYVEFRERGITLALYRHDGRWWLVMRPQGGNWG
jgi:hypothetical protein